ncbi:MAG: AEC family transporter [Candidatus Omnitrophica bacterium]|nr:AEC family transporter [Candidatus Omnitrophota bacterium]
MLNISFQSIGLATLQIFITGSVGYILGKKGVIKEENLKTLSKLLVYIFLPCLIFSEFVDSFSFSEYENWWFFPLLSFAITLGGFLLGKIVSSFSKNTRVKNEILALTSFQNAGYIPLIVATQVLSPSEAGQMYVYIFLFLAGFNLAIWSLGVCLVTGKDAKTLKLKDVFNPPMLATVFSLIAIFFNIQGFVPGVMMSSVEMFGACALPIAILVVGANLAGMSLKIKEYKKEIVFAVLTKVIFLPLLALLVVFLLKIKGLVGFLIILESVVPSATTLVVISKYFHTEEKIISKAILYGHLLGLLATPIFLTVYIEISKGF